MKILLLLLVWALPVFGVIAQESKLYGTVIGTEIKPDSLPQYPGGEKEMFRFISQKMRFPMSAIEDGVDGKVFVAFVINEEGKLAEATVEKGVRPDLNAEALRVVKLMKAWTPAYAGGKPVHYRKVLPIMSQLR